MKITPTHSVKAQNKRFAMFQNYLKGARGQQEQNAENGQQPMMSSANIKASSFFLSATCLMLLSNIGWCLSENSYNVSISKLNEIKPGIKLKIENQKKINASNRATSSKDNKALTPQLLISVVEVVTRVIIASTTRTVRNVENTILMNVASQKLKEEAMVATVGKESSLLRRM